MNWISFQKDKPKYSQPVLLYQDNGGQENFFFTFWDKSEEKYREVNNITHWLYVTSPNVPEHTQEEINNLDNWLN